MPVLSPKLLQLAPDPPLPPALHAPSPPGPRGMPAWVSPPPHRGHGERTRDRSVLANAPRSATHLVSYGTGASGGLGHDGCMAPWVSPQVFKGRWGCASGLPRGAPQPTGRSVDPPPLPPAVGARAGYRAAIGPPHRQRVSPPSDRGAPTAVLPSICTLRSAGVRHPRAAGGLPPAVIPPTIRHRTPGLSPAIGPHRIGHGH